ncbi:MAG: methyltransferase domain-containing protein [Gemmatimonadota bacterium]
MKHSLLRILACPHCRGRLIPAKEQAAGADLVSGHLQCSGCSRHYPVENGIPRFVDPHNYADSFGFQWNVFSKTQLDSYSGVPISRGRLHATTGWDWSRMQGKKILDVGCGAGRFAEVALQSGAEVVGVDYSKAIDAAQSNLSGSPRFSAVQASIFELPFVPGSFDFVYCLGVLQHTPDPQQAFARLPEQAKNGGRIAVDVYPLLWTNLFWSKYWVRPFTKKMRSDRLLRLVQRAVPSLLQMSRRLAAIPLLGRKLKYLVPVVNYESVYALSEQQLQEWAVLDTFDMLSPEHDHPKSESTVRRWLAEASLADIEVFRTGHVIGRGTKVR